MNPAPSLYSNIFIAYLISLVRKNKIDRDYFLNEREGAG